MIRERSCTFYKSVINAFLLVQKSLFVFSQLLFHSMNSTNRVCLNAFARFFKVRSHHANTEQPQLPGKCRYPRLVSRTCTVMSTDPSAAATGAAAAVTSPSPVATLAAAPVDSASAGMKEANTTLSAKSAIEIFVAKHSHTSRDALSCKLAGDYGITSKSVRGTLSAVVCLSV